MNDTATSAREFLAPLEAVPPALFETPRLKLRAVRPVDSRLIFELYASDPVATKYMSFKCTGKLEDTEAFVGAAARNFTGELTSVRQFVWVIESKEDGAALGSCGIGPKNAFCLAGGYILAQRWWGKGYASEAWKTLVNWAKAQPGVFRIEAEHHPDNPASGKVMLNSGMNYEGILRRFALFPNIGPEPQDVAMYAWTR